MMYSLKRRSYNNSNGHGSDDEDTIKFFHSFSNFIKLSPEKLLLYVVVLSGLLTQRKLGANASKVITIIIVTLGKEVKVQSRA